MTQFEQRHHMRSVIWALSSQGFSLSDAVDQIKRCISFYDLSGAHFEALKENWRLSPPVREGCTSSSCLTPTLPAACVCYSSPYLSLYVSAGCTVRRWPLIALRFQRIPTLCLDFVIFSAAAHVFFIEKKKVQHKPISSPPSAGGQEQTHATHLKLCHRKYRTSMYTL